MFYVFFTATWFQIPGIASLVYNSFWCARQFAPKGIHSTSYAHIRHSSEGLSSNKCKMVPGISVKCIIHYTLFPSAARSNVNLFVQFQRFHIIPVCDLLLMSTRTRWIDDVARRWCADDGMRFVCLYRISWLKCS